MLCLGFQHDQRRLQSSQWEGQQRMWWYEDRTECTFSGTAYPTEPADVDFQVLMVTASGLIVQFLKVLENYQNVKWM